jgi:bifunctional non-homologous end joining protein LigD
LEWEELEKSNLHAQSYTAANIFQRLDRKGDPWKDFDKHAHSLGDHRNMLDQFIAKPVRTDR